MEGNEENSLTPRQLKFIPFLLSCPSIEEACRKAHVSRPTVYGWFKEDGFSGEVRKQKDLIYSRAIDSLIACTDAAVAKLMKLLNSRNENIALRAAQSIITLAIRSNETKESQGAEEHQRATGIFSGDVVKSAWERDVRSGAIDVTDEKKNTIKRKSEVDLHSINNRP